MSAQHEVTMLLSGWERVRMADGLLFRPPDGSWSTIRLWPELAPLAPLRVLLDRFVGNDERVSARLLTTAEGEYGAIATARNADTQRTAAWIFGPSSYAAIHGRVDDPARRELVAGFVERLAHFHTLGLGTERWRPYFYSPPAGWTGIAHARSVGWIPPDYPRSRVHVRVFDARPVRVTAPALQYRRLYEQLPRELGAAAPTRGESFETQHGLHAEVMIYTGPGAPGARIKVIDTLLTDGRFGYLVRLECPESRREAGARALMELAHSVRPLPRMRADPETLDHWAE